MDIQHTQRRIYAKSNGANGFGMKQVVFWIMAALAFISVISLGMVLINYSLRVNL